MQKTSRLKNYSNHGLTLLEVLIVLAIMGFLIAFGLPKFKDPKSNVKSVVRKMAVLSREVRHNARIKRMTYRMVFRMGGANSATKDAYWVENAPANTLIPSQQTMESLAKMSSDEKPPEAFQKATNLVKDERDLPKGLYIGSIETQGSPAPITEGLAYIYFTQEGLVEKSMIQITNKDKLTWTLIINPLTGHVDLVEKPMRLKDLQVD